MDVWVVCNGLLQHRCRCSCSPAYIYFPLFILRASFPSSSHSCFSLSHLPKGKMEVKRSRQALLWIALAALLSHSLVVADYFEDQKNYYTPTPTPDPNTQPPPSVSYSPPPSSSGGGHASPTPSHGTPPSHGGGSHGGSPPSNCGNPPSGGHHHSSPPSTGGGSYYRPPPSSTPSTPTPTYGIPPSTPTTPTYGTPPPTTPTYGTPPSTTPTYGTPPSTTPTYGTPPSTPTTPTYGTPPSTPIDPGTTPTTPATPTTPTIPGITIPSPPFAFDPNSPPFTCNYWRNHPTLIWGLVGWLGTVGNAFGGGTGGTTGTIPATGANMNLLQALSNTRTDGYGNLYREGTAALLNSMSHTRFPYSSNQVRDSFVRGLSSNKAAAAQAQLFKMANEGRLKPRA